MWRKYQAFLVAGEVIVLSELSEIERALTNDNSYQCEANNFSNGETEREKGIREEETEGQKEKQKRRGGKRKGKRGLER